MQVTDWERVIFWCSGGAAEAERLSVWRQFSLEVVSKMCEGVKCKNAIEGQYVVAMASASSLDLHAESGRPMRGVAGFNLLVILCLILSLDLQKHLSSIPAPMPILTM